MADGQIYVRHVPPELKLRLEADAKERGCTVNDVAVQILAAHYGVEADLSGRKSVLANGRPDINVRVPDSLDVAIRVRAAAARPKRSPNRDVAAVLCAHYGLRPLPLPRRGGRQRKIAA